MGILIPQLAPASEDRVSGAQVVDGSLNFDSGSSNYLNRTPGSASNRRTWTASFWTKSTPSGSTQQTFIQCRVSANTDDTGIGLENDKIRVVTGAADAYTTKRVLRDPSGWYHVVVVFDTTQSTDSDRVKIYVNGELDTGGATSYPSQNTEWSINTTSLHAIGRHEGADTQYLNSKLSQFYLIDGLALGPGYFGFTDPLTGTWRPKKFRAEGTTVNDGTVWSNFLTTSTGSFTGGFEAIKAFDGNPSTYAAAGTGSATDWIGITSNLGIKGIHTVEIKTWTTKIEINGVVVYTSGGGTTTQTFEVTDFNTFKSFGRADGSKSDLTYLKIDGVEMLDSTTTNLDFGTNGFYLPMDGNSPIGEDKSGKGNDWTPLNFGGSAALDKATGALPILSTVSGGKVATTGVRTDPYASSLVLAIPGARNLNDVHADIKGSGTNKTVTDAGSIAFSSTNNNFYSNSIYSAGSTNQYFTVGSSSEADFNMTGDFTIEFWHYPVTTGYSMHARAFYFGSSSSGGGQFTFYANDIDINSGSDGLFNGASFSSIVNHKFDQWNHHAITREGNTLRYFQNGVLLEQNTQTTPTGIADGDRTLYVGGSTYMTPQYWQDFRIYNGVAKYTSNFIPASTDPDILPDTPSGVSGTSNLTKVTDGAVSFNGTSDYLDIADSADFDMGTGDFTLECFVNSIDNSDYQGVFGSGDYDDAAVILQISNAGLLRFTQSSGTLDVSGTTDLQNTGWHHIVMCRSGTTLRGFVDGRQEISTTYSSSIDWGHSNNSIVIGKVDKTDYPTQFYYKGHISNLRLVKGTALYTSNFTPPTSPLTNVTNTKLLCCKSPNLAGSATVTPNSSLGNISRVWSEEGTGGGTIHGTYNKVAALFTYTTGTDVDSRFLSGSTSGDSIFYKPPSDIAYSSSFSLYLRNGDTDNSTISYSLDGGVSYTNLTTTGGNGSWVDISGSGTITSLYGIRVKHVTTAGTNAVDWRGIKVDSSILLDPVVPFGDSAPNTFNPFDTDINTVRGQESGYCTWNPLTTTTSMLFDGNLLSRYTSGAWKSALGSIGVVGDKWYWENQLIDAGLGHMYGIALPTAAPDSHNTNIFGVYAHDGTTFASGAQSQSYTSGFSPGDVIGVALDLTPGSTSGTLTFYKNGVSLGVAFSALDCSKTYFPWVLENGNASNGGSFANFGQKPFKFPPPAGFQPLIAANVRPSTVIARSDQYVGVSTYIGTASTKSITSLAFQPDFVWLRRRDAAGNHNIQDVVRGASAYLQSDSDGPESTGGSRLASFDLNGFTVTGDNGGNTDGGSYVAWTWKAGGGKNTFNIDGVGYANASDVNMSVGSLNSSSYNQTQTWSNGGNTSNMQNAWSASFDGNFSNFALPDSGYDTLLTFSPAISYTTLTLMVTRDSNAPDLKMNGVALGVPATNTTPIGGTYKIERFDFYNGTLSSIGHATRTVVSQGGSGFYQIIVDGKILVDNGVTPPDLPSIASTGCSVGTKQGFSIIKATGSNSGSNIAHGLGKIPKFVIAKDISNSRAWYIYHGSLGTLYRTSFDTAAATVDNQYFGTGMTDTIVTLKSGGSGGNNYNGANMIYYVWADVPGLQKFGKYVSNGLTDGNFVELGFKPALLIIKSIDYSATTTSWAMYTSDLYSNQYEKPLFVNKNASEGVRGDGSSTGSLNQQAVDLLSNGFKLRNNGSETNEGSSNEYIYAAWAEAPTVNLFGGQSNAR